MSDASRPLTVICIACYFKGPEFLREAKRRGCRVFLITSQKLSGEAWPREALDDIFYVADEHDEWNIDDLIKGVAYLARRERIDRIVPLDDYDLEKAARLREHLRIPGLGDTRTRFFRDKLAMRTRAREAGIQVPDFVAVINHDQIRQFSEQVPPPWVMKPRSQASATGIKKIHSSSDLWKTIDELGDKQSFYVLERFVPGHIYHVDSIVDGGEVAFARVHQYSAPPMQVAHHGGIFSTHSVEYGSESERSLQAMNRDVMKGMGLRRGVSHTEFIQAEEDGRFYFLETSARVGGANIAEMLQASSGLNLWAEWARLETLRVGEAYQLPTPRYDHSGILISLARQEYPDTSAFNDPEIVWRLDKRNHAGLIVASPSLDRVKSLLHSYTERFYQDFFATAPPRDKPTA